MKVDELNIFKFNEIMLCFVCLILVGDEVIFVGDVYIYFVYQVVFENNGVFFRG